MGSEKQSKDLKLSSLDEKRKRGKTCARNHQTDYWTIFG